MATMSKSTHTSFTLVMPEPPVAQLNYDEYLLQYRKYLSLLAFAFERKQKIEQEFNIKVGTSSPGGSPSAQRSRAREIEWTSRTLSGGISPQPPTKKDTASGGNSARSLKRKAYKLRQAVSRDKEPDVLQTPPIKIPAPKGAGPAPVAEATLAGLLPGLRGPPSEASFLIGSARNSDSVSNARQRRREARTGLQAESKPAPPLPKKTETPSEINSELQRLYRDVKRSRFGRADRLAAQRAARHAKELADGSSGYF